MGEASVSRPELLSAIPVLPAIDLRASTLFYSSRFGFEVVYEEGGTAVLDRDSIRIVLWHCDDPEIPKQTSCRVIVRGIDALFAELESAGVVHPNGALEEKPWGFREFTALDACGNAIVFAEPVEPAT